MIHVRYFASLRARLSRDADSIESSEGAQTVAEVLARIEVPDGQTLLTLFESETLLLAVNHEMVSIDHPVTDGDEVGVFPPVTGG